MRITKDGRDIVIGSAIVAIIFVVLALFVQQAILSLFAIVTVIFFIFCIYFFRDPERSIVEDETVILSPGDGKVVQIDEVNENEYFKAKVKRVSVFLSVFNVHVNRIPISGKVAHFSYHRGKYLAAYKSDASLENERTVIGIESNDGKRVLFSQIAGILARRIICHVREGQVVRQGERMGMIRFGSRVDILFPSESAEIKVAVGDVVKGGKSIIGVFR